MPNLVLNIILGCFESNVGLRQGDNLSLLLFAIFLNDLVPFLMEYYNGLSPLNSDTHDHISDIENDMSLYLKMYALLYSDDTAVMAKTIEDLQIALNVINKNGCLKLFII